MPVVIGAGVAFALVLVALPVSGSRDWVELGPAVALGVGLVLLATFWRWGSRRSAIPPVAFGYMLMVALLRDGTGGSASGFAGLYYLPILGIALMNRRRTLLAGLFVLTLANVIPILVVGDPQYPTTNWRGVLVQVGVGALAGFTLQGRVAAGRDQLVRLRRLDKMKDEFLSLVSHELRTPLTSIRGYVDLLPEDPLSETQDRFVKVIQRNVARLSSLVEDLLFVARLDEGRVSLTETTVDIAELLGNAADTARPMAAGRDITIDIETERVPPVRADRERIAQMIDNLVSNAVKFTPEGGAVTLRASNGDGRVHVAVSDTGIGIPADEVERLFERFFRASTATQEQMPGTGLGLAISQSIAEAHGTRLDVASEVGRGTTFSFDLATAE